MRACRFLRSLRPLGLALAAFASSALAGTTPPGAVADLTVVGNAASAVTVAWTAPGDDGDSGTAASYDLRYSIRPITDPAGFDQASQAVGEPPPLAAGTPQTFEITGLAGSTIYYFALRATDDAGNTGGISNAASGNTSFAGYGYAVTGGSGGDVYHVTSLADSGPGSLRSGIDDNREGPRTIVFDVGGTITLTSDIRIFGSLGNDALTIDGSTAPAPGITIRKPPCASGLATCPVGDPCLEAGEFKIGSSSSPADNVILTHLRFHGNYELSWGACGENSGATLGLQYHFVRIVLDHLTIRNGADAAPDLWSGDAASSDVTISNTLMAFSNHPMTVSGAGGQGGSRDKISLHHNVLARSGERMPQLNALSTDIDFRNNVVFDWSANGSGAYGTRIRNPTGRDGTLKVSANIVNNRWIHGGNGNPRNGFFYGQRAGSESSTTDGDGGPASCTTADGCAGCPPQGTVVADSFMGELWVAGNVFPVETCERYSTVGAERAVPPPAQVPTDSVANLAGTVVSGVGTRHRLPDEQALLDEILSRMGVTGDPPPPVTHLRLR